MTFQFRLALLFLTACGSASVAQAPAQYQVIKLKYKILSSDGDILPGATLAARLDTGSSRMAPDKNLKAGTGEDEYAYSVDDPGHTIFSSEQTSNADGLLELPVIVYQNRPDPIDYELIVFYGKERSNRVYPKDQKRAFSSADAGATVTLQVNAVQPLTFPRLLMALLCWLGATVMGALLFFRGVYRSLLASGKSIDLSRALCWSGVLLVSLLSLGLAYWLFLPKLMNLYIFLGFLLAIWFLHLLFAVLPKRR